MKKILVPVLVLFLLVFISCTSAGDNGANTAREVKPGVVNQMTTDMFKSLVYNYQKSPGNWVYEGKMPCVIDFYADWCRPCKMVAPIMDDLANQYKGKVLFYRVNTDQERELSQTFNIQSIPAILYVPMNEKPQMSVGLASKDEYIKQIQSLLIKAEADKQ
jgi:thioredoxin